MIGKKVLNNQNKNDLNNLFLIFGNYFSESKFTLFEESANNEKSLSICHQYTTIIINRYLNEKKSPNLKRKILTNKINERNIQYIIKIFRNNELNLSYKKYNNSIQKMVIQLFMVFNYSLLENVIDVKQKYESIERDNSILLLNKLLNNILNIIGKLYLDEFINDENFEIILKLLLIFSMTKIINNKFKENIEIFHSIFASNCISLIKIVFKNILIKQNELTIRQEEIINNIIIFLKDTILLSSDDNNKKELSYVNKMFLSKNEYKILSLIDLILIISKTKSKHIMTNYIDLLSDIYYFSFDYKRIMKPMLKLLEPLFIYKDKKNIKQIDDDLNISDFSLSFLNSLFEKENQILIKHPCYINQGFYLGKEHSGIVCDFNSFENEFSIIFGFKLDNYISNEFTLFQITKENSSKLKLYLKKEFNIFYEMYFEDKKGKQYELKIPFYEEKYYILSIHFKIGGLVSSTIINFDYIKDDINDYEQYKAKINIGKELKIPHFKTENLTFYFGCEKEKKYIDEDEEKIGKFQGIIGDIIILNSKNIKNFKKFTEELLCLRGNYRDIISILGEKNGNSIYINKQKDNKNIIELKNNIYALLDNENKINDIFKIVISSNDFKLFDYQDNIDCIKLNGNNNNKNNQDDFSFEKKYIDLKINPDPLEDKKMVKIYTSVFNKNFHVFQNNFTMNQFIKFHGINYLSLLMEYYYQILSYIIDNIKKFAENDIKNTCKKINKKIIEIIEFFLNIITQRNISANLVNKFLYQMSITLLKLMELFILDKETIKCLFEIMNSLHNMNSDNNNLIKINLLDFLLNKKLYQKKDEEVLEKLNLLMKNYFDIIKKISNNKTELKKKVFNLKYFKRLFYFLWIFDNNIMNNNSNLLKSIRHYYSNLLVEFLIFFSELNHKNKSDNENKAKAKTRTKVNLEDNIKVDGPLIYYFFDKTLEYRKKNIYIFSNMINILFKTKLVSQLDESKIDEIKSIVVTELNDNKYEKNNDYRKLLYLSCLKILISYYFIEDKKKEKNINNKEQNFHSFMRSLNINSFFFKSLFSFLNNLNYLYKNDNYENELINENDNNLNNETKKEKGNNLIILSKCPLLEMDFQNLSEIEIRIIKSIFEDLVFLLYKFEIKKIEKENIEIPNNKSINLNQNNEQNIEKELFDTIKENINNIFKLKETKICKEFFSSDNSICAEFYFYRWIFLNNEEDNSFEKSIKDSHKYLLKYHSNPFIFKFYMFISIENINIVDKNNNNFEEKIKKIKISLLSFIVDTLKEFQTELIKDNEENNIFYISNLLNYLILLYQELENNSSIFEHNSLNDIIYEFVTLLDKSGLLYSNFYIELNDKYGKIISEIIYDIFFTIPNFDKKLIKTFIKENKNEKEIFTIFYLIDLFKEKILVREKKINNLLKKYIPNIDNLRYIHENYFSKKKGKSKIKLFLNKKLYQIECVNFSIYFLAKSFIYLNKNINKKFRNFLTKTFLPILSKNISRLYTKRNDFYDNKIYPDFLLYTKTKIFIETYIIQNPDNFESYNDFFNNDMPIIIKEEFNISYCYSSRFLNNLKIKAERYRSFAFTIDKQQRNNTVGLINTMDIGSINENIVKAETQKTFLFIFNKNLDDINKVEAFNSNKNDLDSSNKYLKLHNFLDKEEKEYFNAFEIIKDGYIISNPKKYFFRIVFGEIYKKLFFNDKIFKCIKSTYLSTFRKYKNINKDSKQINYPVKQKNFSNFIEPKIFLSKDFSFYEKRLLEISHSYIKFDILNKKKENILFYPHIFKIKEQQNKKYLYSELVTTQYIYFGKMYFFEDYIFFESENDEFRNNKTVEMLMKYGISVRIQDYIPVNKKSLLIYNENINEIVQRRTLLVNQSIEIYLKDGKTYFFNFFRTDNVKQAYNYFNEINHNLSAKKLPQFAFNTNNNEDNIKNLKIQFRKGNITNYKYILYLNKYSTRTYNDIHQYPVFPWIVREHDKIPTIISLLSKKDNTIISQDDSSLIRNMKYPISLQKKDKREETQQTFLDETRNVKFPGHLGCHYSTAAFIYFYLMRINPFGKNLIKLQNYKLENPNRLFNSFSDIEEILKTSSDNREAIPDFFSYFDYFCNLNCCFYDFKSKGEIVDDFILPNYKVNNYINSISSYAEILFNHMKLINNTFLSKILVLWIDIIFGKKQLPESNEEIYESCNIYNKLSYEQKTNLEQKMIKKYELYKKNEITEEKFIDKFQGKIDFIINFGVCPKMILNETVTYEGKTETIENIYKVKKANQDQYIYFNRLNTDKFLLLKDDKTNKSGLREAVIFDRNYLEDKGKMIFNCKSMNLMKKVGILTQNKDEEKINLYNIQYAFSYLLVPFTKPSFIYIFLSCRYFENYFRIQYSDKILNIFYEDFVTCIRARSYTNTGENIFYTGLLNGKLTEWRITLHLHFSNKNIKNIKTFMIKENKCIYAHESSITAIEVYLSQNVIITSGEDKFVYIRKIADFELLTAIDLTYSFGNPIISRNQNIFPSLLKVSDLNLLYILLYDYDSKSFFIRGYNLNGLFFAQTDPSYFNAQKTNLQFNNITFTKNNNLIVGFHNINQFYVLSASNLTPLLIKDINHEEGNKIQKTGTKLIEYNSTKEEFYILYDNEYIVMTLGPKDAQEFDIF